MISVNLPKWKFTAVLIFCIASPWTNLLFFGVDILPTLLSKMSRPGYQTDVTVAQVEKSAVAAAMKMFASEKLYMPWNEPKDFLSKVRSSAIGKKTRIYFFPRIFLALGLVDYAINVDQSLLGEVTAQFDAYYIVDDGLRFEFTNVDQTPVGLAAIRLYRQTGNEKYRRAADAIFHALQSQALINREDRMILYRKNKPETQYIDAIGLVCPFLVEYGLTFDQADALRLAEEQVRFYVRFGLDEKTGLPFHAVSVGGRHGLGPNNWGRGLGWYMLGISALSHGGAVSDEFAAILSSRIEEFSTSIHSLRTGSVYSQFPGVSALFDSSVTTMLFYGENMLRPGTHSKSDVLKILRKYIREDGLLDLCSGDAMGIDRYSAEFGVSELSQGMLLSLLSQTAL